MMKKIKINLKIKIKNSSKKCIYITCKYSCLFLGARSMPRRTLTALQALFYFSFWIRRSPAWVADVNQQLLLSPMHSKPSDRDRETCPDNQSPRFSDAGNPDTGQREQEKGESRKASGRGDPKVGFPLGHNLR